MTDECKHKVIERAREINAGPGTLDDLCAQIVDAQDMPGSVSAIRAHYENMNALDARREVALRIAKLEAMRNDAETAND